MGSDNKLGIFLIDHLFQHRKKRKLAQGRKRYFRLVQQVQALGDKTFFKQFQKTFSVRVGVEIFTVLLD